MGCFERIETWVFLLCYGRRKEKGKTDHEDFISSEIEPTIRRMKCTSNKQEQCSVHEKYDCLASADKDCILYTCIERPPLRVAKSREIAE